MLPPPACGGGIGTPRIPGPGTPVVPQNGSIGSRTPGANAVLRPLVRSKNLMCGWSNSPGGSSPNPGMMHAHPHSGSSNSRNSIASASPGLGALDVDRAGQRVDQVEVERGQVGGGGVARDLAAGEVVGLGRDHVAGLDPHHRLDVDVPAAVGGRVAGDDVLGHR